MVEPLGISLIGVAGLATALYVPGLILGASLYLSVLSGF